MFIASERFHTNNRMRLLKQNGGGLAYHLFKLAEIVRINVIIILQYWEKVTCQAKQVVLSPGARNALYRTCLLKNVCSLGQKTPSFVWASPRRIVSSLSPIMSVKTSRSW